MNSKSSITRTKIIESAKRNFRKNGFKNTTIQMIADEAGISLSLVKKYFPQKNYFCATIARNQAFMVYNYVGDLLSNTEYKDDALMKYLLMINIMFRSIYIDPEVKDYHYEVISFSPKEDSYSTKTYDYISELYYKIVKQFNINMDPNEFEARKIQIFGAQYAIGEVYTLNLTHYDDLERLEYSVSAACILLGVSRFTYNQYKQKSEDYLKNVDYNKFSLI